MSRGRRITRCSQPDLSCRCLGSPVPSGVPNAPCRRDFFHIIWEEKDLVPSLLLIKFKVVLYLHRLILSENKSAPVLIPNSSAECGEVLEHNVSFNSIPKRYVSVSPVIGCTKAVLNFIHNVVWHRFSIGTRFWQAPVIGDGKIQGSRLGNLDPRLQFLFSLKFNSLYHLKRRHTHLRVILPDFHWQM